LLTKLKGHFWGVWFQTSCS